MPLQCCVDAEYPEEQRRHKLLKQWTLKEAHVKATGTGICSGQLRDFAVCAPQPIV